MWSRDDEGWGGGRSRSGMRLLELWCSGERMMLWLTDIGGMMWMSVLVTWEVEDVVGGGGLRADQWAS